MFTKEPPVARFNRVELKARKKVERKFNRRLARLLSLPRSTKFDWQLVSQGGTSSWKNFLKWESRQQIFTTVNGQVFGGYRLFVMLGPDDPGSQTNGLTLCLQIPNGEELSKSGWFYGEDIKTRHELGQMLSTHTPA